MDIQKVKRKERPKTVRLNLKTTKKISEWMKEENISPQLIFDKAVEEIKPQENQNANE